MLNRRSCGHDLGELVSTTRNTYTNAGRVVQFDFHQSDNQGDTVRGEEGVDTH
jgi:hypothetical protein